MEQLFLNRIEIKCLDFEKSKAKTYDLFDNNYVHQDLLRN